MMRRFARFLRLPRADRRLLIGAAGLHAIVAIAVRVQRFGRVRRLLERVATFGPRPRPVDDVVARVVRAVRTAASLSPGSNCLTEALVAQCLLARRQYQTTLCFGVARLPGADRPFDAHAWLERGEAGVSGARAIVYQRLRHRA